MCIHACGEVTHDCLDSHRHGHRLLLALKAQELIDDLQDGVLRQGWNLWCE